MTPKLRKPVKRIKTFIYETFPDLIETEYEDSFVVLKRGNEFHMWMSSQGMYNYQGEFSSLEEAVEDIGDTQITGESSDFKRFEDLLLSETLEEVNEAWAFPF